MKRIILLTTLLLTLFASSASALPYYELHQPAGGPSASKGIVVVIHGGAWYGGQNFVQEPYIEQAADRFNSWGYQTLNVDYRTASSPGHEFDAIYDIQDWVSIARYNIGNAKPVCLWGASAGGHYALMQAQSDPSNVDCALVEAAPTNLNTMPAGVQPRIQEAFGGYANFLSPINWTRNYTKPLAMATATNDDGVPISTQGQPFVNSVNSQGKIALFPSWLTRNDSGCQFTHFKVNCNELSNWYVTERSVLDYAAAHR